MPGLFCFWPQNDQISLWPYLPLLQKVTHTMPSHCRNAPTSSLDTLLWFGSKRLKTLRLHISLSQITFNILVTRTDSSLTASLCVVFDLWNMYSVVHTSSHFSALFWPKQITIYGNEMERKSKVTKLKHKLFCILLEVISGQHKQPFPSYVHSLATLLI